MEAATLGSHTLAQARQGSNVPVDYTKVKHVKKTIRFKARICVIYDHQENIVCGQRNPDNKILKRIMPLGFLHSLLHLYLF